MKMKCTRITQTMTGDCERDDEGMPVKDANGRTIWKTMPRWDITFDVIGERRKLSGVFNLSTTFPDQASRYVLYGVYEFTDITSVAN